MVVGFHFAFLLVGKIVYLQGFVIVLFDRVVYKLCLRLQWLVRLCTS